METVWFILVALMIVGYVILDGFDIGAGIIHLYVARTDEERRTVLQSIGPLWDGNEVWLIAGGSTLFLAFPKMFASSFSGFYLPLIIVLWLLVLRGISIEFRRHVANQMWKPLWDVIFSISSLLLAIFFGAAIGNVVRGVPLDAEGYFFNHLWTTFGVGPDTGILDWYTIIAGVTSLVALSVHGALWVALKTDGDVNTRAKKVIDAGWIPLLVLAGALTVTTFIVQPHVPVRMSSQPWAYLFPLLAAAGLVGIKLFTSQGKELHAFLSSAVFLAGLLFSAAVSLYPNVLPAIGNPANSLTVFNSAAPAYSLKVALVWWIPGMILVVLYTTYIYRTFAGKVRLDPEGY